MESIEIKIETSNSAFDIPKAEVIIILNKLCLDLCYGTKQKGNLKDLNGNTVGYFEIN